MKTPVLLIVFNRPDVSRTTFKEIRAAKPCKLYIAADGPRIDRPGESEKCAETRNSLMSAIDWECEVKTKFESSNLGCEKAVPAAIDWLFSFEDQGIILEDDCMPNSTFFQFCETMLDRYRDHDRVRIITGSNFEINKSTVLEKLGSADYYFSSIPNMWGWATWKRAWRFYDHEMNTWKARDPSFRKLFSDRRIYYYWNDKINATVEGRMNTWDYLWCHSCLAANGLTIVPRVNLISNIGFGEDATHTKKGNRRNAQLPTEPLDFPLTHPDEISVNHDADWFTYSTVYGVFKRYTWIKMIKRKIKSWFGRKKS